MDYLDSNGLSYYDRKIKGHIDSVIENSVLPMIPKKGVVSPTSEGWVSGSQVYNAIGSGGGGGTVTAEFPFPYVKIKKCKRFVAYSYHYTSITPVMYEFRTSDYTIDNSPYPPSGTIDKSSIALGPGDGTGSRVLEYSDAYAFDASFYYPNNWEITYSQENKDCPIGATYTSEGEMEIHNYYRIPNNWMTFYYIKQGDVYPSRVYSLIAPVLRIDDKIKIIGSKAFCRYNKYTDYHTTPITLYISAVEPPVIQSDTFGSFNAIHVPAGSLDLYKSASNWSAYGDYMIGDL